MRILITIDQHGWAFDFVARGIKKYSRHDCTIKRWNEVVASDGREYDCLFCLNDSVWYIMEHKQALKKIKKKCVGIRGEEMPSDRILEGWTIGAVNKRIYDKLISNKNLPVKGVYLTRNGVDDEIFKPIVRQPNRFVVGWAGNPHQQLKRYHLLRHVNFPLLVRAKHGQRYFKKNRPRDGMIKFYGKIDCFINISIHEGMPQTILEAAATKLPIVVTDVGGMPEFVEKKWVIKASPEKEMIKELNRKLKVLKDNPKLRFEVGEKNFQKFKSEWTWKERVKSYDEMFEGA